MRIRRLRILAAACLSALAAAAAAQAPPSPLDLGEALTGARHAIALGPQGFSGEGATLLRQAVSEARYVAIGEDHFTREIPHFAGAVCDLMAPKLAAYVVEAGPVATETIAPMLSAPDREARMAAFGRLYPNALAFLDSVEDNEAAAHCAKASRGAAYRLIGIDQEFFGAPALLLD
jgi:hypothetical protein